MEKTYLAMAFAAALVLASCGDANVTKLSSACSGSGFGSSSQCDCAAKSLKGSLPDTLWPAVVQLATGQQTEFQQSLIKLGFGGSFSAIGQIGAAMDLANRSCGTRMR